MVDYEDNLHKASRSESIDGCSKAGGYKDGVLSKQIARVAARIRGTLGRNHVATRSVMQSKVKQLILTSIREVSSQELFVKEKTLQRM